MKMVTSRGVVNCEQESLPSGNTELKKKNKKKWAILVNNQKKRPNADIF